MKNFVKFSKVWMLTLLCGLFLGFGIKAEAAPGQVTGLKQIAVPEGDSPTNTVAFEWKDAVGSPTKYQIEYCENTTFSGSTYVKGSTVGADPEVVIDNLAAGKSYYVRVAAIDTAGTIGTPSAPFEVVTAPAGKVTGLKQTKLAAKKISLSWKKVSGADSYIIAYKKDGSSSSAKSKTVTSSATNFSASTDSAYAVAILPINVSKSGYQAGVTSNSIGMYMYTTPRKVTGLKLFDTGSSSSPTAAIAAFSGKISNAADGYEYEIYGSNNKRLTKKSVKNSGILAKTNSGKIVFDIKNNKIKNNQFMKIRIRPYVLMNGKKKAGSWSDYLWFAKYPTKLKAQFVTPGTSADGINISWSKVAGATNYTLFVSRGSRYSGYKKIGDTSATSYTFNSVGGSGLSNGVYYYYVVANKKVGKKTYKSDTSWKGLNGFTITTTYSY